MKIVYDNIVYDLQEFGGISSYWFELSRRLLKAQNVDLSFVGSKINKNFLGSQLDISTDRYLDNIDSSSTFIARFRNPKIKVLDEPFIFHSSYNRYCRNRFAINVTTVHDFTHQFYYFGPRRWIHNLQKYQSISKSQGIITVSNNTKKDLLSILPRIDPDKVFVVYNGVSNDYFKICPRDHKYLVEEKYLEMPYLLYVGSRSSYKNFRFAVDVIEKFGELNLFIVGSKLSEEELAFLQKKLPGRWYLFESIGNNYLNELYNHAVGLLYPSSYEGFGIPLLEAMKAGCPFIALNRSSIPEVAGDAGVLVEELNICSFTSAIDYLIENREILVKRGFHQVQKFSWEKTYLNTVKVYKSLFQQ